VAILDAVEVGESQTVLLLNDGNCVLIDSEFYQEIRVLSWHLNSYGYVVARDVAAYRGTGDILFLHRVVLRAAKGQIVDHINGNPLDCRSSNLRLVTVQNNGRNRGAANSNSKSGHRGVFKYRDGRWEAAIKVDGRTLFLGRFWDIGEAIEVRRNAELLHFGEHARKEPI
jgi:hypothetical protein